MEELIQTSNNLYERYSNRTDSRVASYPLTGSDARPVFGLLALYLFFTFYGQKYMEKRAAFNIPIWVLFSYNFGLVILSCYIVHQIVSGVIEAEYNLLCQPMSTSTEPGEMKVVDALWWYYISKIFEFFDTVWMVLRKKNNQISFLHVFHHASMLLIEWIVFPSIPGGQSWFGAGLNSVVHIFMYFYYALSAVPSLRNALWWKKYLTYFQLVQFILTTTHTLQGIISGCNFPIWGQYLQASFCVMMFILFSNFFRQEYVKKKNHAKKSNKLVDRNNNEMDTKKVE